ncbi:MAG: LacI family DNA-binding transcriptional regulator, partial [Bacteroidota bacterium]
MAKKVSISDVAKSLNLSKTVVSLVINGKGDLHRISKETQERVKNRVKEMNYEPNALAIGFRTGKSHTIGLIVTEISNTFYSKIASCIEDLAWRKNYSVVISSTNELAEKENRQIKLLCDRKMEGIIISSSQQNSDHLQNLSDEKIPHILIDRKFSDNKIP